MFVLGFSEILLILAVALLVFGPAQLPQAARSLGRIIGELRRAMDDVRREIILPPLEDPGQDTQGQKLSGTQNDLPSSASRGDSTESGSDNSSSRPSS